MNPKLKELRGKVEHLRKELAKVLEQAGPDLDMAKVTCVDGDSATKVAYFQALNAELDEKMEELEPLEAEHAAMSRAKEKLAHLGEPRNGHPGFPALDDPSAVGRGVAMQKSFGQLFVEGWKDIGREKDRTFEIKDIGLREIQMKALMDTAAGWAPETIRTGRLVDMAVRPIQLIDVIPSGSTSQSAVVYMEETTFTDAAVVEKAEGTAFGEAGLALTEQSSPVRKIPVFLPVTDEQLEDVPQVQGYVNNRLPFMIRRRLDSQILNGNGTAPNLRGILNVVGIQTQAKGTDPTPDAIYKAMVKVRVTGRANPGLLVIHPNDWQDIRLLRTADGLYIFGSPQDAFSAEGTAVVGDFAGYSELAERRGVEVKVSDSHADFFVTGKLAIRADGRWALVWYRPAAFCTVTGI
jgi:HK97 family phage major capsid protein